MSHSVRSASEAQTRRLGADLAQRLREGDTILLSGPLGAGKTTFVRGFLEGLGYLGPVKSPTFNLIQSFETTPRVMHADLYRIASIEHLEIQDYLDDHICIVEWPEQVPSFTEGLKAWRVAIRIDGEERQIEIRSPGDES